MRSQPNRAEAFSFEIVRRILTDVEIDDTIEQRGPGQVDAHIVYPDSRRAALEITILSDQAEQEVERLLANRDFKANYDGLLWWWIISIPSSVDLRELDRRLPRVLQLAEGAGAQRIPTWSLLDDDDARWLSHNDISGHGNPDTADPAVPARAPGTVHLMPDGHGGAAGDISLVPGWLTEVMQSDHLRRKAAKLAASGLDERHLYLIVDHGGAPFAGFYALAWGNGVPDTVPNLGGDVTHVWLAPRWGVAVLTWSANDGWQRHEPYDNRPIDCDTIDS